MPFTFERLSIPDVVLVKPRVFGDDRGFFLETYKQTDFVEICGPLSFVQVNHSRSEYGVLRGLHYQRPPMAQGKLLTAVRGTILDVAVDIRWGSPTYGRWVGEELSDANHHALYVPPGFAHGFCVLSDVVDLVYMVTEVYAPECDSGVMWNDPEIGVEWPIADPKLSPKDQVQPALRDTPRDFVY